VVGERESVGAIQIPVPTLILFPPVQGSFWLCLCSGNEVCVCVCVRCGLHSLASSLVAGAGPRREKCSLEMHACIPRCFPLMEQNKNDNNNHIM
jgi:hypothetical protein